VPTAFVSAVPDNALGAACVAELRRWGVDTSAVRRTGERLGLYFLEAGAAQRASAVLYDRRGSALATARREEFDWPAILAGARWLHVSGITAAISASAAALLLDAVRAARSAGVTVSCDYNYRATLWRDGRRPAEVLRPIVEQVDVGIAGRDDCTLALGIPGPPPGAEVGAYEEVARRVLDEYPAMRAQVVTLREGESASRNSVAAIMVRRDATHRSRRYEIEHVVDRVGSGDAFSAGLIWGLVSGADDARALELATAACCLKHSIPGDVLRASAAEIEAVAAGEGGGRIRR
jgi:2-dehydro-3-deoxygluconokinase